MAQLSSSKAKAFALAITGATALTFSAAPASAQSAQQVTIEAKCAPIRNPAQNAQCHYDEALARARARTNAAQVRIMAADQESSCADTIKSEVTAGRIKPEALRDALAGRPAREVGACNLLSVLTRS